MAKENNILDANQGYWFVPKSSKKYTIKCPYCGNNRTLVCFNVGNKENPQIVNYDYSMCSSPNCREKHKEGTFPRNSDFAELLKSADERDGNNDTELKLKAIRKHLKNKVVDNTNTELNVNWGESEKQYKVKYSNSFVFSNGMVDFLRNRCYEFHENQLGKYLSSVFGTALVKQVADMYQLFSEDTSGGKVQYAYYDYKGNLRNVKQICYDSNGHRTSDVTQGGYFRDELMKHHYSLYDLSKEYRNERDYYDNETKNTYSNCELFLFGEHLVGKFPNAEIIIVESEKSALILQMHLNKVNYGKYIVLATGSMYYFRPSMFVPLKGRIVNFYADNDKAEEYWKRKLKLFGDDFFTCYFVNWKQEYDKVKEKDDIADMIVDETKQDNRECAERKEKAKNDVMLLNSVLTKELYDFLMV